MKHKVLIFLGLLLLIIAIIAIISASSNEDSSSNSSSGQPTPNPPGPTVITDPYLPVNGTNSTPNTFYGAPVTKNSVNYKYTGADGIEYVLPILTPQAIASHPDPYGRVRLAQWLMFSQLQFGNPFPGAAIIMNGLQRATFKNKLGYPAIGLPNLKGMVMNVNFNEVPPNTVYVSAATAPTGNDPYVLNSSLAQVNTLKGAVNMDYPATFQAGPIAW